MNLTLARTASQRVPTKVRRGAGRPTHEQAKQRQKELLDRALELFLEKGFELATIEAIAASVGMTKRTVYARYKDKNSLFKATVERAIERWIVPIEALRAVETNDLQNTLLAISRILVNNTLSDAGVHLMRIINVESYRFPEIATLSYEQGTSRTVAYLTELLRRHSKIGTIKLTKPNFAATDFLSLIVGGPARAVVWGHRMDKAELEERTRYRVRLFLDGLRPR